MSVPQVIILNPNGTVNEELMLANGMTLETIRAVTDAATGTFPSCKFSAYIWLENTVWHVGVPER